LARGNEDGARKFDDWLAGELDLSKLAGEPDLLFSLACRSDSDNPFPDLRRQLAPSKLQNQEFDPENRPFLGP